MDSGGHHCASSATSGDGDTAAPAAATQILYRMRGGQAQDLSVDLRRAVVHINPLAMFTPTAGGYPYQPYFVDPRVNPLGFNIFPCGTHSWGCSTRRL